MLQRNTHQFFVDTTRRSITARLFHEYTEQDLLAIVGAILRDDIEGKWTKVVCLLRSASQPSLKKTTIPHRSNEELHLVILFLIVVVVVLGIVVHVATILVEVVLHGVLVNFEPTAFQRFLKIKLAVILVVVVVVAPVLILSAIVETLVKK